MSYYYICPKCGANLDPGEKCDCTDKELPFVTVPDDCGTHDRNLYEEVGQNGKVL